MRNDAEKKNNEQHRSLISIFSSKIAKNFAIELMNFIDSIAKNSNFAIFLRIFDEFFSGFRAKFQKIVTCAAFSIKFAKTNQKFAENSEFCEKNSLLLVNYSLRSLGGTVPRRILRAAPEPRKRAWIPEKPGRAAAPRAGA